MRILGEVEINPRELRLAGSPDVIREFVMDIDEQMCDWEWTEFLVMDLCKSMRDENPKEWEKLKEKINSL